VGGNSDLAIGRPNAEDLAESTGTSNAGFGLKQKTANQRRSYDPI
jgi:hypothetical protein